MPERNDGPETPAAETQKPKNIEPAIIAARLPLVTEVATDYVGQGLSLDELVGAGVSGLELSVELAGCPSEADPDAYAAYWIRRSILGAIVAKQAVDKFIDDFQNKSGRRPNLAEIRGYGSAESERMDGEVEAYVRVTNDFVDDFLAGFGQLPSIPEAEAFGQARRQQLKDRLGSYVSEFLVTDRPEDLAEFEPGPLYVPDSWLAGLEDEPKKALILRYGLDGSGVKETRLVAFQMKIKTRKVGEIINKAIVHLAEKNGIDTEKLLIYPNLFDGLAPDDQNVLARRLGVFGSRVMEVREVAEELGISCETVRNAEWRAIRQINENADRNLVPLAANQRSALS